MATQADVCSHLGLKTLAYFRTLVAQGVLPSNTPRAGWDIDDCRMMYIHHLRSRAKGIIKDNPDDDGADYRLLLEKEKWRKLKRLNDVEDEKLIPKEVLQEKIEALAQGIIPILQTLVPNIKRQFPELTGDQALIIEEAVSKCLNTIAETEI